MHLWLPTHTVSSLISSVHDFESTCCVAFQRHGQMLRLMSIVEGAENDWSGSEQHLCATLLNLWWPFLETLREDTSGGFVSEPLISSSGLICSRPWHVFIVQIASCSWKRVSAWSCSWFKAPGWTEEDSVLGECVIQKGSRCWGLTCWLKVIS